MDIEASSYSKSDQKILIAVDIDNALCDFIGSLNLYVNTLFSTFFTVSDYTTHLLGEVWGVSEERAKGIVTSFCSDVSYSHVLPFPRARLVLSSLKDLGYFKFYAITDRGEESSQVTDKWLNDHYEGIFEEKTLFSYSYSTESLCQQLGIKVIIDDRPISTYRHNQYSNLRIISLKKMWKECHKGESVESWTGFFELMRQENIISLINSKLQRRKEDTITIAISGKIGSGKDTIYDIIHKNFPLFTKQCFAYKVKKIASEMTGVSVESCSTREGKAHFHEGLSMTIGQLLQKLGEGMKKMLGDGVWADLLLSDKSLPLLRVITDCRCVIETERLTKGEGKTLIIRVNGDPAKIRERNEDNRDLYHSTETELDDYPFSNVIENNGTLLDLETRVISTVVPFLFNCVH